MSDVKEKLQTFVKEESQGVKLAINGFIFGLNFLSSVGKDGFVSAFFGAAVATIIVAALSHFVVGPLLSNVLKR